MVIAQLTTDNRENFRDYTRDTPWFGSAPEALMQGFAALPEVTVHVVACAQRRMASPPKISSNIFFHSLHVGKIGWLRTGYQGCIRAVRSKLAVLQPDIVHGQGTERDCAISAVFSGFPNVVTVHGNMRLIARVNRARPFTYQWFAAGLERFTIPRADGVVCITSYTEQLMKPLARKTWVLPNAVHDSFFDVRNEPAHPPNFLCVGNIQPRKNQNALIRALDPLVREHSFSLTFLGPATAQDSYGAEFLGLVQARNWCVHAGSVARNSLQDHLTRATALILPSLEDNCPMVVLEAMAAGVPVLGAGVGGVPELIKKDVTGLIFDPLSAASMRDAVAKILLRTDSTTALAAPARREAFRRFHSRHIAKQHLEIYREVLSTRS